MEGKTLQRTFPKKTTANNNLKSKSKKGKGWRKCRQKYTKSIFDESDGTCNNDETNMKSKHQPNIAEESIRHSSDEKEVEFTEPKKSVHSTMNSPVEEHEKSDLDTMGFRAEVAKIPLGKAKQLQERLGKKLFDKAFFVEDSSSDLNRKSSHKSFVRENPKRPREVSSKIPVSKFRNVFENEKLEKPAIDPRFDSRYGEFNDYIYHNNYSFLDEIRQQEKKILMKELKNTTEADVVNRNRLKEALRKMKNQEKTQADVNRRKEVIREIRHENNERMRQGLPPVFKTRAQIRELIWRKKYDELKGGKKLEKYLRRKTKKQDKRSMLPMNQ
ncbi:C6orf153 protein, putative [Brugia malayi]|uniref:rRNA biogenesis protein RRP36 n=3 Tax=Brugia TaxID=6278 RepID=A0A0J9Y9M0_BRUMA|nr:C6orf153 protein, putative [Brugia malayi]CDQ04610.1 Bm5935, isoform b [Brugia malayi]VIO97686.1 C6orf153 protein, putative [Brugia malayi]